ncbi:MAG: sodium-dependent transporter, partial [Candidatus Thiodiazotropha sp.]
FFNIWSDFKIFDKTFFDLLDYLTANIMLPLGGLLIALFSGWLMKKESSKDEFAMRPMAYQVWWNLIRYISPFAVIVVFLHAIGII